MKKNNARQATAGEWHIDLGPISDLATIDPKNVEWLTYSPARKTNGTPDQTPAQAAAWAKATEP